MKKWRTRILFLFFAIALAVVYYYIKGNNFYTDEQAHAYTINNYLQGFWEHPEFLTTLPGYHYIGYLWAKLTSLVTTYNEFPALRLLSTILSFATLGLFFLASNKKYAHLKTLSYFFLPITLPYFFLAYTETTSTLFVLAALLLYQKKYYHLSALPAAYAVLVRQPNIMWAAFIACLILIDTRKIKNTLSYILIGLAFATFVFINGGVSMGDTTAHPSFAFHLGNIYFALTLFFIIFLPTIIGSLPKSVKALEKPKFLILAIATTLFGLNFVETFTPDHPYNNVENYDWFLRNNMLATIVESSTIKRLVGISFIFSMLTLAVTKLQHKKYLLIYPFAILSLIPFWLIEHRYYAIPFILFILLHKPQNKIVAYAQLMWMAGISSLLLHKVIVENGFWFL